jgi:aminoglycoside phosphotransferase (APT) family kinase protein
MAVYASAAAIGRVVVHAFGATGTVTQCTRMTIGLCNEVYRVDITAERHSGTYIIRLNKDASPLLGMCKYAPMFSELRIRVPRIIDGDYNAARSVDGYSWQVQEYLDGVDACLAVPHMTREQIQRLAAVVAHIHRSVQSLGTDGGFGWVGADGKSSSSSWLEVQSLDEIIHRNSILHVLPDGAVQACQSVLHENRRWLAAVPSVCYFDDMSSKNLLVNRQSGAVAGLCDIDGVAYGDPLEALGRIQASFVHVEPQGQWYCDAIASELQLTVEQRRRVAMYALLNATFWATENGWGFNETNPSQAVDQHQAATDLERHKKLLQLYRSFGRPVVDGAVGEVADDT